MNALDLIGCASRAEVLVKLLRACGPMQERDAEDCCGWPHKEFVSAVASATMSGLLINHVGDRGSSQLLARLLGAS